MKLRQAKKIANHYVHTANLNYKISTVEKALQKDTMAAYGPKRYPKHKRAVQPKA